MKFGEFNLSVIRECRFRLDGGAMFGIVPKVLWDKVSPADSDNRVLLSCNLLLIDTSGGRVLVETGMGDRWDQRERDRYQVQTLVEREHVLAQQRLKNEDVDAVVVSHLHFDHAGGATRMAGDKLVPTFPKARYYIQRGEWDFAHRANARARGSYRPDDYEPLAAAGNLALIDGDTQVVPGVWARVSGGHTSHHQVVTFESCGKKGIFLADIMPTRCHVHPPWTMGYDHYPLQCCDVKSGYLKQACEERWLVVFDHEPDTPWGYIELVDGKFSFVPCPGETDAA